MDSARTTLDLVRVAPQHYDFVRNLRMDPRVSGSFLEEANITEEDQQKYMDEHGRNYYVCLSYGTPVGYAGVVENDIRICTQPEYFGIGVASFMLEFIKKMYPHATGQIKGDNYPSQRLFDKVRVPYVMIDENN